MRTTLKITVAILIAIAWGGLVYLLEKVAVRLTAPAKVEAGPGHLVCPRCHYCIGHVVTVKSSLSTGEEEVHHEHEARLRK